MEISKNKCLSTTHDFDVAKNFNVLFGRARTLVLVLLMSCERAHRGELIAAPIDSAPIQAHLQMAAQVGECDFSIGALVVAVTNGAHTFFAEFGV